MKKTFIDEKIVAFVEKNIYGICILFLVIFSVGIRYFLAPFGLDGGDYADFLAKWLNAYSETTLVDGLSQTIGNYYVPYNILLALITRLPGGATAPWAWIVFFSCLFEYIGVFYLYKLLCLVLDKKGMINNRFNVAFVAVMILYLPPCIINGALWKQCDAIYACFVIASIYYLLSDRPLLAFIFLSIGYTFKQQALFIVPFFIITYVVKRNYSLISFAILPLIYYLAGIPAILCGRPASEIYSTYSGQYSSSEEMFYNAFSVYQLSLGNIRVLGTPAFLYTAAVFAIAMVLIVRYKKGIDNRNMLLIATWSLSTCYMFLPVMHERYDYLALIFIAVSALLIERKLIIPLVVMVMCTTVAYGGFVFDNQILVGIPFMVMAAFYIVSYFFVTYVIFRRIIKDADGKYKK